MSEILMVYGHQWVPRAYFDRFYAPRITRAFAKKSTTFVVGAAPGVDTFTQELLARLCGDNDEQHCRVSVFNRGERDYRVSSRFALVNGFSTYRDRDVAMFRASTARFCVFAQFGSATSGCAFVCLLDKFAGDVEKATDVVDTMRALSEPYSKELEQELANVYAQRAY